VTQCHEAVPLLESQRERPPADVTLYDRIASFYDPWSRSVTEDVGFYVERALASGGPVVELAVGTGRIAVPIAEAGIDVIGVDSSPEMLAVARASAEAVGVLSRLDLRVGDLRTPPVGERVPLVICPFRSLLHMETEDQKLRALVAARDLLEPAGSYVFDVFAPSREDIDETHDRWLEREPGIFERAVWDESSRTLSLSVRSGEDEATFGLHWLSAPEWLRLLERAELEVETLYGWFDERPYAGEEDMIFTCRRAS
jgi:SAM-dependent methyltransferase